MLVAKQSTGIKGMGQSPHLKLKPEPWPVLLYSICMALHLSIWGRDTVYTKPSPSTWLPSPWWTSLTPGAHCISPPFCLLLVRLNHFQHSTWTFSLTCSENKSWLPKCGLLLLLQHPEPNIIMQLTHMRLGLGLLRASHDVLMWRSDLKCSAKDSLHPFTRKTWSFWQIVLKTKPSLFPTPN